MTRQGRRASTHEPLPLEQIPVWRAQPNEDPQPAGAGDGVDSLIEGLNPEATARRVHGDVRCSSWPAQARARRR